MRGCGPFPQRLSDGMDATALLEATGSWLSSHPGWAGLLVFAIAMGESLAIVGLFVPGAVLMFVVGALVGGGMMELWPTLGWAAAGAVAGDGISYWIGRHYHERLRTMWPFRRYPVLFERGEQFFLRHGGKSVLFGRFVGPVRPVIPLVAGMMDMPAWRFALVNLLSALLWAPVYILPGVVFSSSLSMATEVAGRMAVLLLVLLGVLLATLWLARAVFRLLQPRANPVIAAILGWSRRHPLVGGVAEALLDPDHPEARGLAVLAALLFAGVIASALLVGAVLGSQQLDNLNLLIYNSLQQLRTPWADRSMVLLTWFGDGYPLVLLLTVAAGWLWWRGDRLAPFHLLVAAACTELMVLLLKMLTAIERPVALYHGVNAYSFPSGHAAMSTVVYGMLAIIVAGALPVARRWWVYGAAGLLAVLVGFSRLYLGAHWLSDVLGGFMLGGAWAALLGIAYRRHSASPQGGFSAGGFTTVLIATLLVTAIWGMSRVERDMQRYAPVRVVQQLDAELWWRDSWRQLPAYRQDLRSLHDHPMTLQWAGGLGELQEAMLAAGWHTPVRFDAAHLLQLLSPGIDAAQLPLLPQVNDGRHEALRLVRATQQPDQLLVLRLWPTDTLLMPGERPLWYGNVSRLRFSRVAGMFSVARTMEDFVQPLERFVQDVQRSGGITVRVVWREPSLPRGRGWDGRVILLRAGTDPAPAPPAAPPGAAADR